MSTANAAHAMSESTVATAKNRKVADAPSAPRAPTPAARLANTITRHACQVAVRSASTSSNTFALSITLPSTRRRKMAAIDEALFDVPLSRGHASVEYSARFRKSTHMDSNARTKRGNRHSRVVLTVRLAALSPSTQTTKSIPSQRFASGQ